MRVLILSDVHGNLPALEYILKEEKNSDLIISLGDVVNYGPWSNECVDLLETCENKILIKGNHEDAFITGNYPGTNMVAKSFFNICYPTFNRKMQIEKYILNYSMCNFNFTHTLNDVYIYPDTDIEFVGNTFIGHSHRMFMKEVKGYKLVNVGSLGQNRVNIDEINYVIWTTENNTIDLVKKPFDSNILLNEMKIKGYPDICIDYIVSKKIKN